MVSDTGLHPAVFGDLALSFPGTNTTVLSYVGEILSKGGVIVANATDRNIVNDVQTVFKIMGVETALSYSGIKQELVSNEEDQSELIIDVI